MTTVTVTLPVGTGTQQWTPPVACQIISKIELWGPGGSGGRYNGRRATGGGAGAYKPVTGPISVAALLVAGTIPYQTGRGGTAATANGNGNNGSAGTWFSAAGTYYADFGRAGQTGTTGTTAGGIAGLAANCIPTTGAVSGGVGGTCSSATGASGGGASGSANGAGVTATAVTTGIAGAGAIAPSGGGSGGNASITSGTNAIAGTSPGGAGGAANTAANSGAGADGQIIVTYTPLWPGNVTINGVATLGVPAVGGAWSNGYSSGFGPFPGAGVGIQTTELVAANCQIYAAGGTDPWSSDFSSDFGPTNNLANATHTPGGVGIFQGSAGSVYVDTLVMHLGGVTWAGSALIQGYAVLGIPIVVGVAWSSGFSAGWGPLTTIGTGIQTSEVLSASCMIPGVGPTSGFANATHTPAASSSLAVVGGFLSSATHTPSATVSIGSVSTSVSATATWIDVDSGPELIAGSGGQSITASHTPSANVTINTATNVSPVIASELVSGTPVTITGVTTLTAHPTGPYSANATLVTGATLVATTVFTYQGNAQINGSAAAISVVAVELVSGVPNVIGGAATVGPVVAFELVSASSIHIIEVTIVSVATALLEAATVIAGGVSLISVDSHVIPGVTIWNGLSVINGAGVAGTAGFTIAVDSVGISGFAGSIVNAQHTPAATIGISAAASVTPGDKGIVAAAKITASTVGLVVLDSTHTPAGSGAFAGAGSAVCSALLDAADSASIAGAAMLTAPTVFALGAGGSIAGGASVSAAGLAWQSITGLIAGSAAITLNTFYRPAATIAIAGTGVPTVYALLQDYQSQAAVMGAGSLVTTTDFISNSGFVAAFVGLGSVTVDGAELNIVQINGQCTVEAGANFIIIPWIPVTGDPRSFNDVLPWIAGPYRHE